jgi:acyl-CoA thioester hydrolase
MTMTVDAQPARVARPEYGIVVPVNVYFDDLDSFGMLHNSRYALLVERAWITYSQRHGIGYSRDWTLTDDGFGVVRELRISYEFPVARPGEYAAHIWLERIGRTSVTCGFRVSSADGTRTHAQGSVVMVHLDRATLLPAEWSDRVRPLYQQLVRPEH